MDAYPFTWMKSFKLEENKKPNSKIQKIKIKKQVWNGFEPPPSPNMFSNFQCANGTQTLQVQNNGSEAGVGVGFLLHKLTTKL